MADHQSSDQELYSPTSPAESHGSGPRTPFEANELSSNAPRSSVPSRAQAVAAIAAANKQVQQFKTECVTENVTEHVSEVRTERNTDKTTEDVEVAKAAVPQLLAGSKFDKVCSLKANRWIKIGRNPKAQLLLKNIGVSRHHCDLMWDPHQKAVELRDMASGVTFVNGERLKGARKTLAHGDKIRVQGKDINYDFLLDMRPAGLATTDPRQMQGQNRRKRAAQKDFATRREELKKELENIDKSTKEIEVRAFQKEKEYYEIMSRRRLRMTEITQKEEQIKSFVQKTDELLKELKNSREIWLGKIQDRIDDNQRDISPLTSETKQVQEMLEKLSQKKIELERELHPEKYEVQRVELLDEPTEVTVPRLTGTARREEDDEEEAVFASPGRVAGATSPVVVAGDVPALQDTPTTVSAHVADEPHAKRPRADE